LVGATKNIKNYHISDKQEELILKKIKESNVQSTVLVKDFTRETEQYFENSKIFVLPADIVFCNFALLEAMMRGLTPVISNVEGANIIVENNKSGLIRAINAEEFANAIIYLLQNDQLRIEMGIEARKQILLNFNSELLASQLITFYKTHLW
ncbi:glycosyltransferase, partial [Verrucomicrobia bacterium]|nr:glycosyltransferase [Verrucomicrobiota bacterium]